MNNGPASAPAGGPSDEYDRPPASRESTMLVRIPIPLRDAICDRLAAIPEVGPANAPPLLAALLTSEGGSIDFERVSIEWKLDEEDFSFSLNGRYDGYVFRVTFEVPSGGPIPEAVLGEVEVE